MPQPSTGGNLPQRADLPGSLPALRPQSAAELIAHLAAKHPQQRVIVGVDGEGFTGAGLLQLAAQLAHCLKGPQRRRPRVGVLLHTGPRAAAAIVACSATAIVAPLHTESGLAELQQSVRRLSLDFVLSDVPTLADPLAAATGVQLLDWREVTAAPAANPVSWSDPAEPCLLIETSGTTAVPKAVLHSHRNWMRSSDLFAQVMEIRPGERCAVTTPLSHALALAALSSALVADATAVCWPLFSPENAVRWLSDSQPQCITTTATIAERLVAMLRERPPSTSRPKVRVLRLGGAAVRAEVLQAIRDVLGAAVVRSYGMSETLLIASTTASEDREGSVGRALLSEVAVWDSAGRPLPAGQTGEFAVRGELVFRDYDTPHGEAPILPGGWFRTGDLGYRDGEGFLYLTGRLKETINVGGEKVSPLEVEAVLHRHPLVREAAVFAQPHPRLGEVVAAAIVPAQPGRWDAHAVVAAALQHLSPTKVPQRFHLVEELPRTAAGKVRRLELARRLAPRPREEAGDAVPDSAMTPNQRTVLAVWRFILRKPRLAGGDNCFDMGADSLSVVSFCHEIERLFGQRVDMGIVMLHATASDLGAYLDTQHARMSSGLVAFGAAREGTAVVLFPGIGGQPFCFYPLGQRLGAKLPVFAVQAPVDGAGALRYKSFRELVDHYVGLLADQIPLGRACALLGHSVGADSAIEVARALATAGRRVVLVGLLDSWGPGFPRPRSFAQRLRHALAQHPRRPALQELVRTLRSGIPPLQVDLASDIPAWLSQAVAQNRHMLEEFRRQPLRPYAGRLVLFRAAQRHREELYDWSDPAMGWDAIAPAGLEIVPVSGDHSGCLHPPHVDELAEKILARLTESAYLPGFGGSATPSPGRCPGRPADRRCARCLPRRG